MRVSWFLGLSKFFLPIKLNFMPCIFRFKIMIRSLSFSSHSSCFILSASGLVFSYSLKSFFVISQSNSRRLIFQVVDDICSSNSATSNLRFSIISGISYIEVSRLLAICVTSSNLDKELFNFNSFLKAIDACLHKNIFSMFFC